MTQPHIPAYETPEPGAIVFITDPFETGFTDDEIAILLTGGDVTSQAVVSAAWDGSEAFHLHHDQKTHGHKSVVSTSEQADFQKKLKKSKSGDKAYKSVTSSDAFGAKGPMGYGEFHADTIQGFPTAAGYYQTDARDLNGRLRDGLPIKRDTGSRHAGEAMSGAMDRPKSRLKDDIVVERGIHDPHKVFGDDWSHEGNNSGLTWDDAGFVSTTTHSDLSRRFALEEGANPVVMRMHVPKGTSAMTMGRNGTHAEFNDEHEVVLDRGMRYRVMADHGVDSDGIRRIDVEVLGRSPDRGDFPLPGLDDPDRSQEYEI